MFKDDSVVNADESTLQQRQLENSTKTTNELKKFDVKTKLKKNPNKKILLK